MFNNTSVLKQLFEYAISRKYIIDHFDNQLILYLSSQMPNICCCFFISNKDILLFFVKDI